MSEPLYQMEKIFEQIIVFFIQTFLKLLHVHRVMFYGEIIKEKSKPFDETTTCHVTFTAVTIHCP